MTTSSLSAPLYSEIHTSTNIAAATLAAMLTSASFTGRHI